MATEKGRRGLRLQFEVCNDLLPARKMLQKANALQDLI